MTKPTEYNPGNSNAALVKRVNKILQNDISEDKEALDALKGLSSIVTENNLETRRNLRSEIEKKSISVNEEFVASFGKVKHLLDKLSLDVQNMDRECRSIVLQLEKANHENRALLEDAKVYKEEAEINKIKEIVISKFHEEFNAGPEKIDLLRSKNISNEVLSERFFSSLQTIETIHENAKKLLMDGNQQNTAIDIMELTSMYHEVAFERLYRWTLRALRTFNLSNSESMLVQKAVKCLQQKPSLLQYALDEYCNVRRAAFIKNFINALTKGSHLGSESGRLTSTGSVTSQPIDHHANDPLRYVNDIMAWFHQNLLNENSQLEFLLKECSDSKPLVKNSLSNIAEAFIRPAVYRIEQQFSSEQPKRSAGPVVIYKVKSIIQYYRVSLSPYLVQEAEMTKCFEELEQSAQRCFLSLLTNFCETRLGKSSKGETEFIPDDLNQTESISLSVGLLRQLFSAYNSTLSKDNQDVSEILGVILNPIIKTTKQLGQALSPVESAIFQVNCLNEVLSALEVVNESSEDHRDAINYLINEQLAVIIQQQTSFIVSHLGMASLIDCSVNNRISNMSSLAGCDALSLKTAAKNLDTYLADPDQVNLPYLDLLLDEDDQQKIKIDSRSRFCVLYQSLLTTIADPKSGYDTDSIAFLHHSPENVKALLT
ncbi:Conserved oligomeric Golgi complex subunit 6 [Halotydeus destructor]|nr:Conserved oligomeric Golgi complex subunit 6 [Halotydeus destructor]